MTGTKRRKLGMPSYYTSQHLLGHVFARQEARSSIATSGYWRQRTALKGQQLLLTYVPLEITYRHHKSLVSTLLEGRMAPLCAVPSLNFFECNNGHTAAGLDSVYMSFSLHNPSSSGRTSVLYKSTSGRVIRSLIPAASDFVLVFP